MTDPDREDRAEPVGRLQVGEEEDEHRRDHGPPEAAIAGMLSRNASGKCGLGTPPGRELLPVACTSSRE